MSSFISLSLFCSSIFATFDSSNADNSVVGRQPASLEGDLVGLLVGKILNTTAEGETRQSFFNPSFGGLGTYGNGDNVNYGNYGGFNSRRRCPACDLSVYPYCGEKLFHDACCCTDPYQFPLPYKCRFADCAFLHANSCKEHRLISNCCCSDEYRDALRTLGKSVSPTSPTARTAEKKTGENN